LDGGDGACVDEGTGAVGVAVVELLGTGGLLGVTGDDG